MLPWCKQGPNWGRSCQQHCTKSLLGEYCFGFGVCVRSSTPIQEWPRLLLSKKAFLVDKVPPPDHGGTKKEIELDAELPENAGLHSPQQLARNTKTLPAEKAQQPHTTITATLTFSSPKEREAIWAEIHMRRNMLGETGRRGREGLDMQFYPALTPAATASPPHSWGRI